MSAPPAQADIVRGVMKILGGVLQVPMSTLAGTFSGPPILGTLGGVLTGTFSGVGMVLNGSLELAAGALDLAKTVAPYLLPFLL